MIGDNWIYIQEPGVKAGRLQIFNNWSITWRDPGKLWFGVEYFCPKADAISRLCVSQMAGLAVKELHDIQILDQADVLDHYIFRMPKTYPAYFATFSHRFGYHLVRQFDGALFWKSKVIRSLKSHPSCART